MNKSIPYIIGAALMLFIVFYFVSRGEGRATIFHPEQRVRVYSPEGRFLLTGEVRFEEDQYVTICKLQPIAIAGAFKPRQCLTLNMFGPFLVVEAVEPGITWCSIEEDKNGKCRR